MGILTSSLTFPVSVPLRGVGWIARKIAEAAEAEYYDPAHVQTALRALEERLDAGEITESQFEQEEEVLLARLKEIRNHQKQRKSVDG